MLKKLLLVSIIVVCLFVYGCGDPHECFLTAEKIYPDSDIEQSSNYPRTFFIRKPDGEIRMLVFYNTDVRVAQNLLIFGKTRQHNVQNEGSQIN